MQRALSARKRWPVWAGALLLLPVIAAGCHRTAPAVGSGGAQEREAAAGESGRADGGATGTPAPAPPPAGAPTPPSTAPAEVEAAVAARPGDYELRMNAAQYYMLQGQDRAALPHLEAAARLQPRLALPWIALGDARAAVGAGAGARAAYARARSLDPGNPLIDRGLAQLLIREGRLDAARALLDRAVKRRPDSLELRLALGNLYLVLSRPQLAIEVLRPAVASTPNSADAHYLLGQAYERSLHVQAALREQQATVAADPTFVEAYGRIGIYLIDLTRYAEARAPLLQAIRLNPRESHYYWALGDTYLLDASDPNNLPRAIALYHQALGIDPQNGKALMSLALALNRRGGAGDAREAARVLEQLVRQEPANTSALYQLYVTDTRLGRPAAARAALARFRALESRGRLRTAQRYQMVAFVDTADAHLRLGRRDLAVGRARLAATEFRLALQRSPTLSAAREGLARARRQNGDATPESQR